MTDTEIIKRDPYAQRTKLAQDIDSAEIVGHQHGFGNLQNQPMRRQPRCGECVDHRHGELVVRN